MLKNAAIALLLIVAAVGSSTMAVQAQSAGELEVRITAQRLQDGRTEFALQQREGDGWSDRIAPRARFLPAEPPSIDGWSAPPSPSPYRLCCRPKAAARSKSASPPSACKTGAPSSPSSSARATHGATASPPAPASSPPSRHSTRWLVSTPVSIAAPTNRATDRAALIEFYNATNGPDWTNNTNWLSDTPIEQWHGVITGRAGRVVALQLHDNQLSGPIPPELGNLAKLEVLSLGDNQLSGPVPPELGNFTNLETLWLNYNPAKRPDTPGRWRPRHLVRLQLDYNQLSGPISPGLGSLAKPGKAAARLQSVKRAGTARTGQPRQPEMAAAQFQSVKRADSPELGNLANLKSLWLSGTS